MGHRTRLIGGFVSPFVRKVLVTLHIKQIEYELDPIFVFKGSKEFTKLSPLRQVPVLVDGNLAITDSTVICEYLDEVHPDKPIYPGTPALKARARWVEEYADTRLADVLIWKFYYEVATKPFVWKRKPDVGVVSDATSRLIPGELDFLETLLPREKFLFGAPMLADYTIASIFRTAGFAGFSIDSSLWPITAGYVSRVAQLPAMTRLTPFEKATFEQSDRPLRERLAELGVRLSKQTVAGTELQPSIMHADRQNHETKAT